MVVVTSPLPPDVDDFIRRSDLDVFCAEFAEFRADMHAELSALTRTFYLAMVTSMLTMVGLSFTVAHFA